MKPTSMPALSLSHGLLAVSLAANIGFVVYVLKAPRAETATANAAAATTSAFGSTRPKAAAVPAATAAEAALLEKIWSEHAYEDPAAMSACLRAAGISPTTARAYFATRSPRPPPTAAAPASRRPPASSSAKVQAIRAEISAYERNRYGDLPREKIQQIQRIDADYAELTRGIREQAPGVLIPEDREKLAYLEREKLADLAKVLTPQELEDYQIRTSTTAVTLRYLRDQTVGFNATEDEFRAIFRATKAVEAQYGSSLTLDPLRLGEDLRNRQAAMNSQLEGVLSPERLADFKRATDPAHQLVDRLATRLDLPASTTEQVLALQAEYRPRGPYIRFDPRLPVETRNAQLAAVLEEATTKLTAVLTPRGFEAYQKDGAGFWLKDLAPIPAPPPPAKPKS